MRGSILGNLGGEFIDIMSPVSICMFIVVALVYSQSSPSLVYSQSSPSNISPPVVTVANLVYMERPSDSTTQKLQGTLLNAAVLVSLISVATFSVLLLYYYNFTRFLKNYMRFSAFTVLGSMGRLIFLSIIQHFQILIDWFTGAVLYNFAVVGTISVFSRGIPIFLRQGYVVLIGCFVAVSFTELPEWTTWGMLVALALYDLVAVLAPGGPLKMLVELASRRNDDLPGFVYEARPIEDRGALGVLVDIASTSSIELQTFDGGNRKEGEEKSLLRADSQISEISLTVVDVGSELERLGMDTDRDPDNTLMQGILLGLGDFIFYSVLVGRAAMHDLMTVYACYLAIVSGLGCTLILLSVCRQALLALPISITFGMMFYFLTRLLLEPFVVGTSTNLLMF